MMDFSGGSYNTWKDVYFSLDDDFQMIRPKNETKMSVRDC